MKKTSKLFFTLIAMMLSLTVNGQIEMGGWQTMFSYYGLSHVFQTPDKVYAISQGNLFSVDKKYNSMETYSKLTGLSDGEINIAEYDETNDLIVVCYTNQNIDILEGGNTYNISDLKTKEINNKSINNISFYGTKAYLSCGFGIMELNLKKKEIANTYIIGDNGSYVGIDQTIVANDSIYAISADHLYSASLNEKNLNDYRIWTKRSLPSDTYTVQTMAYFGNKINVFRGGWYYWENGWNYYPNYTTFRNVSKVHVHKNHMALQSSINFYTAIVNDELLLDTFMVNIGSDAIYDPDTKNIWLIQDSLYIYNIGKGKINAFCPEGPGSNDVFFLKYDHGKILSGGLRNYASSGQLQVYENNEWNIIKRTDLPDTYNAQNSFYTVTDAAIDPTDTRRMFVTTWRSLYEFYDNKFVKRYFSTNTTLTPWAADSNLILLDNIMFDHNNVLWLVNSDGGNLLKARDTDGNWHSLYHSEVYGKKDCFPLFESENGYKWVLFPSNDAGLFVLDDNGTPFSVGDDQHKFITSFTLSDGTIVTPTTYKCIAEDLNHEIWIGTDVGPLILKNTTNIFSSNYCTSRIKITREDDKSLADYLLSTEQINAIVVDGGNRKWIGTNASGLYLLSEDGQETIHHFTTANSPLTTDKINKLALNPDDGKLYIGTSNGMFIYQTDATEGKEDLEDIHVYPNPVKPDYDGVITVSGLMEDTEVRICTLDGYVVCHGKSNGGSYTWDGYLNNGSHASTGVYFVFAATQDGNFKNVAKFAIIKR